MLSKVENIAVRSLQILYIFVLRAEKRLSRKWLKLPHVYNTKKYKNLQISHCYIFFILQHFATKLCNFTNFQMLFLAVVIDFVFLA